MMPDDLQRDEIGAPALVTCSTCAEIGRRGYCAPLRCYCGHETCHAFASFVERKPPDVSKLLPTLPSSDVWADREEDSWIDKM